MRTVVLSIVVSVGAHATILWLTQRPVCAPVPRHHTVPLAVREAKKPPPPPSVPPPPPPPRRIARLAPKRVGAPPPRALEPPPPPPSGYSVDTKSTVADSTVAVPAKEGGGNPFADPNAGLPPGDRAVAPPPPPPPPATPFSPAAWLTDPADRSPPYPSAALRNEIEGQVLLKVCVAPDGSVESVQLLRGLGFGCDEAAVAWARQHWHFRAATRGGVAVRSCLMQPMRFQLQR